jgi:hypothetical protein
MVAAGRRKRTRIDGQFAAREIKMLESPTFRELSCRRGEYWTGLKSI